MTREHWKYLGVKVPLSGPLKGRPCYIFRREGEGYHYTLLHKPIDEYWPCQCVVITTPVLLKNVLTLDPSPPWRLFMDRCPAHKPRSA